MCIRFHDFLTGTNFAPFLFTFQTVRLWDLANGKSTCTLTHHKKSVRSVVLHPKLNMFASASPDNIKQWKCPNGEFIQVKIKLLKKCQ